MIPKVLSVAGSDPSGGAGIQADLKTFSALECYGMAVMTSLTAQNTQGVQAVHPVPADFVEKQCRSIFDDIMPDAIKIGLLGNAETVDVIVKLIDEYALKNVVLDPVMVATSGDQLADKETIIAIKERLIPKVLLITPNKEEAFMLECEGSRDLLKLGSKAILMTGGNRTEPVCTDLFAFTGGAKAFEVVRVKTENTHGTGCTLSSAIAAGLAQGLPLPKAIGQAKDFVTGALRQADILEVGEGAGPVHHFHAYWPREEEEDEAVA